MDNQEYNYTPTPAPAPQNGPTAKTVMILGIVALALSELGIPGIILAAIALSKAKQWMAANGPVFGMAKVGRILARVALPLSIVMTVFWILYIALIFLVIWLAVENNTPPHGIPFNNFTDLAFMLA